LSAEIRAAAALTESTATQLQFAWERGDDPTIAERGELALEIAAAKVITSRVGLDVSSKLFDITGARATQSVLNLDRYWRNVRVHSLHDPVDYKLRDLGNWALNKCWPTPVFLLLNPR
jgi:alkylation response protein AidB-like acyl-CoA dehydrogenase